MWSVRRGLLSVVVAVPVLFAAGCGGDEEPAAELPPAVALTQAQLESAALTKEELGGRPGGLMPAEPLTALPKVDPVECQPVADLVNLMQDESLAESLVWAMYPEGGDLEGTTLVGIAGLATDDSHKRLTAARDAVGKCSKFSYEMPEGRRNFDVRPAEAPQFGEESLALKVSREIAGELYPRGYVFVRGGGALAEFQRTAPSGEEFQLPSAGLVRKQLDKLKTGVQR